MKAEQLWASILQEAIQGRLVPQLENEPEVNQIGEVPENVPFAVPEKWKWVTLGAISKKIHYGYTASAKEKGNARLLRITDIQNGVVRVKTERDSDKRDADNGKARYKNELARIDILMNELFVQILRHGGSTDEKLRGGGTHDCCQYSGKYDTCPERAEQLVCHNEEYRFGISAGKRCSQIYAADHADEYGAGQRNYNPRHGDAGGFFQFIGRIDSHEAHENMRLTEITEPPCQ